MKKAIVIFSFNRPDILEKCLESIKGQNNIDEYDIYLYQDNSYNPNSKLKKCEDEDIEKNISIFKEIFPDSNVVLQPHNKGVALNHFQGYEDIFIKHKYDYGIFFDDDVLIYNKDSLNILIEINSKTDNIKNIMGSELYTIPFKYKTNNNKILLLDTYKYHVDYKGFCCSINKFKIIYEFYKENVEKLFIGVDYTKRYNTKDPKTNRTYMQNIIHFFKEEKNTKNTFYSQDWVRDTCFRHFGMTKKAILNTNLAKNIGNEGVHQLDKLYKLQGLGDFTPYSGKINIDDIVDINDKDILIDNEPPNNKFSFIYKTNQTKKYLQDEYCHRFN